MVYTASASLAAVMKRLQWSTWRDWREGSKESTGRRTEWTSWECPCTMPLKG